MLTNAQKALLKRAQRQAGIEDAEYRDLLDQLCGCRTSTDRRLGDANLDQLLAYFEAVYWRAVDAGTRTPPGRGDVFQRRGYWAGKNLLGNNSRDRFTARYLAADIARIESDLARLGYGAAYCAAIRGKVCRGANDPFSQARYRGALLRTLHAKAAPD